MENHGKLSTVLLAVSYIACVAVLIAGVIIASQSHPRALIAACLALAGMVVLTVVFVRSSSEYDYVQAQQSDRTLELARNTLPFMSKGLTEESAQAVCDLLLPAVAADAVSITDRDKILGVAGTSDDNVGPVPRAASSGTQQALADGQTHVVTLPKGEGSGTAVIRASVVAPLIVDKDVVGTLRLHYCSPASLNETQKVLAEGFSQLLASQLSLSYLQQQTELATQMELRALQAQINPHFLFNTINTIASTVRTDPEKARVMLREFAVYYRRLIENSEDLIQLSRELEQTERYLLFQKARFGEDNISMTIDVEPGLEKLRVPSFIVQPLVENCVAHGRSDYAPLYIVVRVYHASDSVIVSVADDGVGIAPERLETLAQADAESEGLGIALKNVNARLKACYGQMSGLHIESQPDEGTTVYLTLHDALLMQSLDDDEDEDEDGITQVTFD